MPLTVKVIKYRGHPPINPLEASFDQIGGTLGRSTEKRKNHFTLPDPEQFISRFHASIIFENGIYSLTDTSVDGTYIQNKNIHLRRDTVVLSDGDRLRIGDYELSVHISSNDTPKAITNASFHSSKANASFSFFDSVTGEQTYSSVKPSRPNGDGSWWPDNNGFEESAEPSYAPEQTEESPLHDAFLPPDVANDSEQSGEIPKDFDFKELLSDLDEPNGSINPAGHIGPPMQDIADEHDTADKNVVDTPFGEKKELSDAGSREPSNVVLSPKKPTDASIPAEPVNIRPMHQQAHFELFRVFLDAAGIKDADAFQNKDISEMMKTVGHVFREMIDGLMAILRGRSELKSQLQVSLTRIEPADNNPLKFFKVVDEAVKQMLINDNSGFVDAKDAVREGYADVIHHQLAITAGIQAAINVMIQRFDPQHFEEGSVFHKKAKAWDAYRQSYTEIANDALEDFFGESFANAYEAQIRKLRPTNNTSGSGKE